MSRVNLSFYMIPSLLLAALVAAPVLPPVEPELRLLPSRLPSATNTCQDHKNGLHSWIGSGYVCVGDASGTGTCTDDNGNKWSEKSPCVP